ncbi:MAG: peptide deformylase [Thermoleophilia bacterium]|nr:peptide deformylase [Thermoleophilia bacterium]
MPVEDSERAAAWAQIRQFGDPVLKEKSHQAQVDEDLRALVDRMIRIMDGAEGVGLAAPQIGVLRRVIVFRLDKELNVLVNPEITWRSEETVRDDEGCLSLASLATQVERAEKVRVEGEDLDGKHRVYELKGLKARILQHEIDHLEGMMIIDRASREGRKDLLARLSRTKQPGE